MLSPGPGRWKINEGPGASSPGQREVVSSSNRMSGAGRLRTPRQRGLFPPKPLSLRPSSITAEMAVRGGSSWLGYEFLEGRGFFHSGSLVPREGPGTQWVSEDLFCQGLFAEPHVERGRGGSVWEVVVSQSLAEFHTAGSQTMDGRCCRRDSRVGFELSNSPWRGELEAEGALSLGDHEYGQEILTLPAHQPCWSW